MSREDAAELVLNDIPDDPPEGFRPLPMGDGFNLYLGPVYGKMIDGSLRLGMRVGRRHLNPHRTMHGGITASFADMQLYASQQHDPALRTQLMPTISLSLDYISPVVAGDWLEGHTMTLKATRAVLFQQTLAKVGERIVFRSSCVYRLSGREAPEGSTLGATFSDIPVD
ncbi:PaaI family thioesterase [Salipiger sp.]|uniref:PaaI family thioesterase n=1 Tax=Salipiger sp. TaxID=2078585 RepID=UPI003A96C518